MTRTAASSEPSDRDGGRLWARIFEPLNDDERRAKYDEPLAQMLNNKGIEHSIRGFTLPADANHQQVSVGIEVLTEVAEAIAFVAEAMAALGAPPTTIFELETNKASVRLTVAEIRDGSSGS